MTEHSTPDPTTPLPTTPPPTAPVPTTTPAQRGGWRGWPRAAVVAVLAACLVAIGGVAFGVTMAAGRSSASAATASPTAAAAATPTTPGAGAGGGAGAGKHHHVRVRGTITAIAGDVWTVRTKRGPVSVTIAATTAFGTKKAPTSRSRFTVGTPAVVVAAKGTAAGATSMTAARISPPQQQGHATRRPAPKSPGTGTGSGSAAAPSSTASSSSTVAG